MSKAWPQEQFITRLKHLGERRYHHDHPFHRRMHDGKLTEDHVRAWILNRFYYQRIIPVKDAVILSKLPTIEARRRWLPRITEQDGVEGEEGGLHEWLRLGEAAGIAREEMLDVGRVLPGVRFACDAYVWFCRDHTWWEAVAASLTQMFVPGLMQRRIAAFEEHYGWVHPDGLRYFHSRIQVEPDQSKTALDMVVEAVSSREDQERALDAVEFKCDVLATILDSLEGALA